MLMVRGARNTAAQARLIAVSTHSSNVKPRFQETADFARAIHSQAMVSSREGNIGAAVRKIPRTRRYRSTNNYKTRIEQKWRPPVFLLSVLAAQVAPASGDSDPRA
jgi:hypothetical protein